MSAMVATPRETAIHPCREYPEYRSEQWKESKREHFTRK